MPKAKGPHRNGKKPPAIATEGMLVNLKAWRLFRDMTVAELALEAGMSTGNLSEMENLRQGYSTESLARLARALKITPGELLDINPDAPTTGEFWRLWEQFTPNQRAQLTDIAKTFPKEPGKPRR